MTNAQDEGLFGELSLLAPPLSEESRRHLHTVLARRRWNGERPSDSADPVPVAVAVSEVLLGGGDPSSLAQWTGRADEVADRAALSALEEPDRDRRELLLSRADQAGRIRPGTLGKVLLSDLTRPMRWGAPRGTAELLAQGLPSPGAWEAFEALIENWDGDLASALETSTTLAGEETETPVRPVGKARADARNALGRLVANLLLAGPVPAEVQRAAHESGARRGDHDLLEALVSRGGELPPDLQAAYETTRSARLRIAYLWSANTTPQRAGALYRDEGRRSVLAARARRSSGRQ